jgi:hypothetical protein
MVFLASLPLQAEFIQPVAVLVSNGVDTQDALINGMGFEEPGVGSPQSVHNRTASEMWSGIGSIRESAICDLGKTVNLTRVYVWNYNAADATDVGMKEVEVQVSSDSDMAAASFNAIARISLTEGGDKAQAFDVVGTNVRLVKLKGISNWGQGFTVGLAEVRFESGEITGNVPAIVVNSPREGDEIAFGSDVTVDARVTDKDADLQKVELFDGDTLVTNKTTATFTVVLKQPAKGAHALRIVATDKTGKVAWVAVNVTVRELVADRIIKIDDTADEGAELNQISYTGSWNLAEGTESDPRFNHNDHYSLGTTKTDFFEVRFKGVKIDLFATVASHHGSGMASIDGGPESKVTYKAAQRAEQVFVWGSPILANREHVLKVRTFGDGVVTADRFDVSVSDKPDLAQATVKTVTFTELVVVMEDVGASIVDQTTVKLSLDGMPVTASVSKAGSITSISHTPASPFAPGSSHLAVVDARDKAGTNLVSELSFNLPAPMFPLSGLGGPTSTAGNWGLRQVWDAGRVDAIVSAVDVALKANQAGFAGKVYDIKVPFINFGLSTNPGTGGLFLEDQAMPAEPQGLSVSDFVIVARASVSFPRSGDWTIGVHSDDGFALRVIGHPFDSVSGNGVRDDNFPEYMGYLTETPDSNTRGILKDLAAGTHEIELIAFQRVASSFIEIYAAEGAFVEDIDTDQWKLIGGPEGLQILAPPIKLEILQLTTTGNQVSIEFLSPNPDGQHQLLGSTDLRTWNTVPSAVFAKTSGSGVRATVSGVTESALFYRLALP